MQPRFKINDPTKEAILALIRTCRATGISNVGFQLGQTRETTRAAFYATDNGDEWELVVSTGYGNSKRDVYQVMGEEVIFRYAESDFDEEA